MLVLQSFHQVGVHGVQAVVCRVFVFWGDSDAMLRTAVGGVRASDMLLTGTGHWCVQCVIRIVQSLAEQPVISVEFYLYPTVGTVLIHSVKPELTE